LRAFDLDAGADEQLRRELGLEGRGQRMAAATAAAARVVRVSVRLRDRDTAARSEYDQWPTRSAKLSGNEIERYDRGL
jgi:hypothetical protein